VRRLRQDRVLERAAQGRQRRLASSVPQVHDVPSDAQPQDRRGLQQAAVLPLAFAQGLAHSGRR